MHYLQDMVGGFFVQSLRRIGDCILPRLCLSCGRTLLGDESHLCIWCLDELPLTWFWMQEHNQMADKFNALIQKRILESAPYTESYIRAAALYFYSSFSGYSRISQSLKYHADLDAGRYFAVMLSHKLRICGWMRDVDAFVPVPLHWSRHWERGYNQAEVIARSLAKEAGTEVVADLLRRVRRTASQTKLDHKQKFENVRDAFSVNSKRIKELLGKGTRHIALVDDVFTTGATMEACYVAVRTWMSENGVCACELRISIVTLGFVG